MNYIIKKINKIRYFILGLEVKKEIMMDKLKDRFSVVCGNDGNWLDESFKYILAVVIGLAFLAGLYAITKDTILPTLTQKIKDGFNFKS